MTASLRVTPESSMSDSGSALAVQISLARMVL
jgi:hypothetical protein